MNDSASPPFKGLLVSPPLNRGKPYPEMGPLEFEPLTLEVALDLELVELLGECYEQDDPGYTEMIWNGALALYEVVCNDTKYEGLTRTDLLSACIHTARIWAYG